MESRQIEAFQDNKVFLWGERLADKDLLKKYDKGNKNPYSINSSLANPSKKKKEDKPEKPKEPEVEEKPKKNKSTTRQYKSGETYTIEDIEFLNKQLVKKSEEEAETEYESEESEQLLKEIEEIEELIKKLTEEKYKEPEPEKPKGKTAFEIYEEKKDAVQDKYIKDRKAINDKYKKSGKEYEEYETALDKELNAIEKTFKKEMERLEKEYKEGAKPKVNKSTKGKGIKNDEPEDTKNDDAFLLPIYEPKTTTAIGKGFKAGSPEAKYHAAKMRAKKLGQPIPPPEDYGITPKDEPKKSVKKHTKKNEDYTQDEIDELMEKLDEIEDKLTPQQNAELSPLIIDDNWNAIKDFLDNLDNPKAKEEPEPVPKKTKSRVEKGSDEAKERMAKLTAVRQQKAKEKKEALEAEKEKKREALNKNKKPWYYLGDIPSGYREAREDEAIMNKKVSVWGKYKVNADKYFFYETYGINISPDQPLTKLNIGIVAVKKHIGKTIDKLNTLYIHLSSPKYYDKQGELEVSITEEEEKLNALEKGINILLKIQSEKKNTEYKPYEFAKPEVREKAKEPEKVIEESPKEGKKELGKRLINSLVKKYDAIPINDPEKVYIKERFIDKSDYEGLQKYFSGELKKPEPQEQESESDVEPDEGNETLIFYNDEGERKTVEINKGSKITVAQLKILIKSGIILPKEYYDEEAQKYFFYPKEAKKVITTVNTFKTTKGKGIVNRKPDLSDPTIVQSIVFEKDKWTPNTAKKWLKEHNYYNDDIDITDTQLRFRQFNPDDLKNYHYISKPLKEKNILLIIALSNKMSEAKPKTPRKPRAKKSVKGSDLIHIDVGSHNNEPEGKGLIKADTDGETSDEDNLEKAPSKPVIEPETGEGLKKKKTRKPKEPKEKKPRTPRAKKTKSIDDLSKAENNSLQQLVEATNKKKEKKQKEDMVKHLSDIVKNTNVLGEGVKSKRPPKGSEEAKEWARKMREAREAKKQIKQ